MEQELSVPDKNGITESDQVTQLQGWMKRHKKLLIGAVLIIIMISAFLYRTDKFTTSINDNYSKGLRGIYYIYNCESIFQTCQKALIPEADKETFTVLAATVNYHPEYDYDVTGSNLQTNTPYAKDNKYVFLDGNIVPGADPNSFVYLGDGNSYDKNWYYTEKLRPSSRIGSNSMYERYLIQSSENSGNNSKPIIDGLLLIFPNKVVFNGQELPELDSITMKKISEGYYEDKNYLIWIGNNTKNAKLIKKDPLSSFQTIGMYNSAYKDKTRVIYYGQILEGANPAKFEFLKTASGESLQPIGSDGENIYNMYDRMIGIDANTFTYIPCAHNFYKDRNNVYYHYAAYLTNLPGIDPNTFKFGLNSRIADKNGVYQYVGAGADSKPKLISTDTSTFQEYQCNNGWK